MLNLKISQSTQDYIDILKTPFLIVDGETVTAVFSSKEIARQAKKEENLAGKIVDASKCEFEVSAEVADLAEPTAELPDETISPEDEEELAAALDAEEAQPVEHFHTVTEAEHAEHRGETAQPAVKQPRGRNEKQIAAQKESKKLPRQITCITTGEEFKTAFAMYTAKPDWLTMTQRNKLTKELFAAAKEGKRAIVEINGREFQLSAV